MLQSYDDIALLAPGVDVAVSLGDLLERIAPINNWDVCLVAMEPSSGYILLEERHANREAATWTEAMAGTTRDLPVEIVVAGSDEARALVSHIRQGLGAVQTPDLYHMQRELWWGIQPALAESLKAPTEALAQAEATTKAWREHQVKYGSEPRGPGRPPAFDRYIADAQAAQDATQVVHQAALDRQAKAHDAIRSVSQVYHSQASNISSGCAML
jgi:hypothetical protein